jgi:CheY-like chemotaxis protein
MDEFEVCRLIKSNLNTANIPVILLIEIIKHLANSFHFNHSVAYYELDQLY